MVGDCLKHSEVDGDVPFENEALAPSYDLARNEQRQSIYQKHIKKQKARDGAWWDRYRQHLASPEWADTRQKVFKRANGLCEGCGDEPATAVHHLTYTDLGNEFLWQLVAVCKTCHDRAHGNEMLDDEVEEEIEEEIEEDEYEFVDDL